MHDHLLRVSDPKSSEYGQYLSRHEVNGLYGPSPAGKQKVMDYFASIPGSRIKIADHGDLLEVEAKVADVETHLKTNLEILVHQNPKLMPHRAIRSTSNMDVPDDVAQHIKFISLNSPLNYIRARGTKVLKANKHLQAAQTAAGTMGVLSGNNAALTSFIPICADGNINVYNPPCQTDPTPPSFTFVVTAYNNDPDDPYLLSDAPRVFEIPNDLAYCYDVNTKQACSGTAGISCQCSAQVSAESAFSLAMCADCRANGSICVFVGE